MYGYVYTASVFSCTVGIANSLTAELCAIKLASDFLLSQHEDLPRTPFAVDMFVDSIVAMHFCKKIFARFLRLASPLDFLRSALFTQGYFCFLKVSKIFSMPAKPQRLDLSYHSGEHLGATKRTYRVQKIINV